MPIIESAKKQLRAGARRRVFNEARKITLMKLTKKFRKLVTEKKKDEAKALMPTLQQAYDKAVKTNYLKKNTAARKKSRLVAALKKI